MAPIQLRPEVYEAMLTHARFTYPEEACGLLAGPTSSEIEMAFCLTNRERSPYRFTVDPTEHYRSIRHAEARGWDVVGVFHSHPASAAVPSRADVAGALDPEWSYFVVSLESEEAPDVRAFAIRDGVVTERSIVHSGP